MLLYLLHRHDVVAKVTTSASNARQRGCHLLPCRACAPKAPAACTCMPMSTLTLLSAMRSELASALLAALAPQSTSQKTSFSTTSVTLSATMPCWTRRGATGNRCMALFLCL
jgi:hypothetical protein